MNMLKSESKATLNSLLAKDIALCKSPNHKSFPLSLEKNLGEITCMMLASC